jgi:F-type H+-transporting ATPase subunit epsilon
VFKNNRYNKYTQIAARAVRQSLKEDERVAAEKRGLTALRYQHWESGKGGEQVRLLPPSRVTMSWLRTRIVVIGVSQPAYREGIVVLCYEIGLKENKIY